MVSGAAQNLASLVCFQLSITRVVLSNVARGLPGAFITTFDHNEVRSNITYMLHVILSVKNVP